MILLKRLGGFVFDNGWGRIAAFAAGLAALFTAYTLDQRSIGARDARHQIDNAARELVGPALKARDAAAAPGAAERLRKQYCGDC